MMTFFNLGMGLLNEELEKLNHSEEKSFDFENARISLDELKDLNEENEKNVNEIKNFCKTNERKLKSKMRKSNKLCTKMKSLLTRIEISNFRIEMKNKNRRHLINSKVEEYKRIINYLELLPEKDEILLNFKDNLKVTFDRYNSELNDS